MKDVRIDQDGEPRCWNCGAKAMEAKRTFRSKVLVGVGALLTHKKLKCQRCGEYNDTGNGKPYQGPAKRRYRKEYVQEMKTRGVAPAPERPEVTVAEELVVLAGLRDRGVLTPAEFDVQKARLLDEDDGS